jgi:hypothetical protein
MPKKRRARKQAGKGPVWDWIKKAAKQTHDFVKDNRLISRGAATISPFVGPYAGTINRIGTTAGALGYGKRPKKKGRPRKRL